MRIGHGILMRMSEKLRYLRRCSHREKIEPANGYECAVRVITRLRAQVEALEAEISALRARMHVEPGLPDGNSDPFGPGRAIPLDGYHPRPWQETTRPAGAVLHAPEDGVRFTEVLDPKVMGRVKEKFREGYADRALKDADIGPPES